MNNHDERRERIINNILNKWTGSFRIGIYGIEYCQVCGQLKTFEGWIGAMALHRSVNGKSEFVCGACIRSSPAKTLGGFDIGKAGEFANAALGKRPYRICEVCGTQVNIQIADKYDTKIWVCSTCEPKLADEGFLGRQRKRRYIERNCHTDEQLRAFDINMEAERLDLEDTLDPKLKAHRKARVRATLDQLGKIHGEDYSKLP